MNVGLSVAKYLKIYTEPSEPTTFIPSPVRQNSRRLQGLRDMEIELADVSFDATAWDVKRALGAIFHSDDFFNPTDPKDRPL